MSTAYRRKAIGEAIRRYGVQEVEGRHRVRDHDTGMLLPGEFATMALAQAKAIDLAAEVIERVIDEEVAGR